MGGVLGAFCCIKKHEDCNRKFQLLISSTGGSLELEGMSDPLRP